MASLYEINDQILNCIDIETGEILDTAKFDELQLERNEKLENIALYYKNLLSDAEAYKAEKNIFADKQKRAEAKAESLKKYLDDSLKGSRFNTSKVNISYRKSSRVEVDEQKLAASWTKEVTTRSVDKVRITEALKSGEVIEGATLVENNLIRIK